MATNGGNDFDFFAPGNGPNRPSSSPATPAATPAAPPSAPPSAPADSFGSATGSSFGTFGTGGAFAPAGTAAPTPSRRSPKRRPTWVRRLVQLTVLGLLAGAAFVYVPKAQIPDRVRFYTTSIAMPDTIGALTRTENPGVPQDELYGTPPLQPGTGAMKIAVYETTTGEPALMAFAAKYSSPNLDPRELDVKRMNELMKSRPGSGIGAFAEIPAGKLGGTVICSPVTWGSTAGRMCTADSVAVHMTLAFSGRDVADATVLAAREAIEKRLI